MWYEHALGEEGGASIACRQQDVSQTEDKPQAQSMDTSQGWLSGQPSWRRWEFMVMGTCPRTMEGHQGGGWR